MRADQRVVSADAEILTERATASAGRLLAGAGTASACLFRLDGQPSLDAIAHGTLPDGTIVIAAVAHAERRAAGCFAGDALDVRLEVTLEAPALEVRITAASLHLLGELRWMPHQWRQDDALVSTLPEHVAAVAAAPGGRLGIVTAQEALVHDTSGVTRVRVEDAHRLHQRSQGAAGVLDAACALSPEAAARIVGAVMYGRHSGAVLSERPTSAACDGIVGATFPIDADALGVTLMHVGERTTTVVLALFGAWPAESARATAADRCRAQLARWAA